MSTRIDIKTKSLLSATLMKTGQLISYRAGDDGDLQAGRGVDFFTLAENNPFGNTNRFTDVLGGQTYANSIAVDWSTYDGTTVLGYYYGDVNFRNLNDQCLQYLNSTIGGLVNNWYLTNITEMNNIINWGRTLNSMLNYHPFNSNGRYFWLSTGVSDGNGFATDLSGYNVITAAGPGNTKMGIWVRKCTVTGTTLS